MMRVVDCLVFLFSLLWCFISRLMLLLMVRCDNLLVVVVIVFGMIRLGLCLFLVVVEKDMVGLVCLVMLNEVLVSRVD